MLLRAKRQFKSTKIIYFTLSLIINTAVSTQADEMDDYNDEVQACYNKKNYSKIRSYNSKLGVIDSYFDPSSDTRTSLSQSTKAAFLGKDPKVVAYRAHASGLGDDHANHVSSIIHQINQGAKLRVIDIYDEPSVKIEIGHTARLVAAIDAAIKSKVDFINISQRISSDADRNGEIGEKLKDAMYRARDAGIGIIKSAGNDNEHIGSTPYTKSLAQLLYTMGGSMVLVGATGPDDNGHENLANFSNKAGIAYKYMVSAPGTNTIAYGAANMLVSMSGTSMAAPVVTATAGLIKEAYPNLSAREIFKSIRHSARKVSLDQQVYFAEGKYGCGVIDLPAALIEAEKLSSSKVLLISLQDEK